MKTLRLIIFAALLLAPALNAEAQSASVNIYRATLDWTWTLGAPPNDGAVSQFNVKCGQVTLNYTKVTVVANPAARSIPVSTAVGGQGNWFCVVSASNQYGESANSAEVPFGAGAIPSSTGNLVLTPH